MSIVRTALITLEVALVAGLLLLLGHALALELLRRRREPRIESGRRTLYRLLPAGQPVIADPDMSGHPDQSHDTVPGRQAAAPAEAERAWLLASLRRLSATEQEDVILPLAASLAPDACLPLRTIAADIGLIDRALAWCRSSRWWMRLRGARLCSSLCAGESVMVRLLADRHPAVRAQAAEWAARIATPDVVTRLLHMVDDPDALSRFAVQDALVRLGNAAVEPLATFLERQTGPEIEPAIRVAATIPHPRFLDAAVRHAESDEPAVRAWAMRLLGSIGGPEVSRLLVTHLGDPNPEVRAAAVRALGRIAHWPRAPEMADCLRDTSWDVRRSAGLALRDLGSPGILMLRRMTTDANRFAADMARQVLDLPAGVDGVPA